MMSSTNFSFALYLALSAEPFNNSYLTESIVTRVTSAFLRSLKKLLKTVGLFAASLNTFVSMIRCLFLRKGIRVGGYFISIFHSFLKYILSFFFQAFLDFLCHFN